MEQMKEQAQELLAFVNQSKTPYHAIYVMKQQLLKQGFVELSEKASWHIEPLGRYFVTKNGSSLFAFAMGNSDVAKQGLRLIASHSDSPTFKIKPNPDMEADKAYIKLNTAMYGGGIVSTWFDRPLSVAGRLFVKGKSPFTPKEILVDINRPILVIPSLAIHMNRTVNEGHHFNTQVDTLPLLGFINETLEKDGYLLRLVCQEANVPLADLLDFDLTLYEHEKGVLMGFEEELISAPRLDDLWMAQASLSALLATKNHAHTNALYVSDNEEVGSLSAQGAQSSFLKNMLLRMVLAQNKPMEEYFQMLACSVVISADLAHAAHPNYGDKHDPTTRPILGKGPVLKYSVSQKYATTGLGAAVFASICEAANVPFQKFVSRSDLVSGSTVGAMMAAKLAVDTIDMGAPILGMHSIRELGAVKDVYYTLEAFKYFYALQNLTEAKHGMD